MSIPSDRKDGSIVPLQWIRLMLSEMSAWDFWRAFSFLDIVVSLLRFVVHEGEFEVRVFQSTPAPHRAGPCIPIFHDDRSWTSEGIPIKAVAKALSLRGMLDGDEVRRVMDEALEICSNPDVPVAASAARHAG